MAKRKAGVLFEDDLLRRCDENLSIANCKSRNEFISKACEFYIAYLNKEQDVLYISKTLQSYLDSKIESSETRLSKVLYRNAIEIGLIFRILAQSLDIDPEDIPNLRDQVIRDAKRNNGRIVLGEIFKEGE